MVSLLRDTLEADVREGIRFAELLAVNNGMKEFRDLKKEIKEKNQFALCPKHFCSHGITVTCKTCQKDSSGQFCIECFLNGNHEGHEYYLTQNVLLTCVCGHKECISEDSLCSEHKGYKPNPEKEVFDEEQIQIFREIFDVFVQYIIDNFQKPSTDFVVQWLSNLAQLGDAFIQLISEAFLKDKSILSQIFEKIHQLEYRNCAQIVVLFSHLDANPEFSHAIGEFSHSIIETYLSHVLERNSGAIKYLFDTIAISFFDPAFSLHILQEYNLLTSIFNNFSVNIPSQPAKRMDEYLSNIFPIIYYSTHNKQCSKYMVSDTECVNAFCQFLSKFQFNRPIIRKSGDKEVYDNFDVQFEQNSLNRLIDFMRIFISGYSSFLEDDKPPEPDKKTEENENKKEEQILTKDDKINILFEDLNQCVTTFNGWFDSLGLTPNESPQFEHPFIGLNALATNFSFALPLNLFFNMLIHSLHGDYKFDPKEILSRIKIDSLMNFCVHPLETVAAVGLAQANAYVRNSESVTKVANEINLSFKQQYSLLSFYSIFQYYIETTDDPSEFIASALQSLGLTTWFATSQVNPSIELQAQLILLFRLFITTLSSNVQKLFDNVDNYRIKTSAIHFLYLQTSTAKEITSQIPNLGATSKTWDSILDEIAITVKNEKNNSYKLKPEFKQQRTTFFPFYLTKDFYQALALEMETKEPKLLLIPEVEHEFLPNVPRLVSSKGFRTLIDGIAHNLADEESINNTVFQCFLALIHMGVRAAKIIEDDTFPRSLIENETSALRILTSQKIIEQNSSGKTVFQLLDVISELFPDLAPHASEIKAPFMKNENEHHMKIDRNAIMSSFMMQMDAFQQLNADAFNDLDDTDDEDDADSNKPEAHHKAELICAFCKSELIPGKDEYGIMARVDPKYEVNEATENTVPLFNTCQHYAHLKCYTDSRGADPIWTQCPLCRQQSSVLLPVLGISEEVDKVELPVVHQFLATAGHVSHPVSMCSSFFGREERILRVYPDYHFSSQDIVAGHSIIALARGDGGDRLLPRRLHGMEKFIKTKITTKEQFWNTIKDCFGESPPRYIVRRCALMTNLDNNSEIIPLSSIDDESQAPLKVLVGNERQLFIFSAYKKFTEYFLKKNGFTTKMMQSQKADFARCLCCGEFVVIPQRNNNYFRLQIDSIDAHCRNCSMGMPIFLFLTGKRASAVIYYYSQGRPQPIEWGSIYLTSRGDQDIGLTLLDDLYLSEDLVKKLLKDMYDGTLYRNSKRRDAERLDALDNPLPLFFF